MASFAFVQSAVSSGSAGSVQTATFGSNPTVGNMIVVLISNPGIVPSNPVYAFTDIYGNSYVNGTAKIFATATTAIFYCLVANTGSGFTISWQDSSTTTTAIAAFEFSFTSGYVPVVDAVIATAASGSSITPSSGNLTLTSTDLMIGVVEPTVAATYTAGSGFTLGPTIAYSSTNTVGIATEYNVAQSSGSVAATFSLSGSSQTWYCQAIAFKLVTISALTTVANADLQFTPYNWRSNGSGTLQSNNILPSSTYAITNNTGAAFTFNQTRGSSGGAVYLQLDTSGLNGLTASYCPQISVFIVNTNINTPTSTYQPILVSQLVYSSSTVTLPIAWGLYAGTNTIVVMFRCATQNVSLSFGDRWNNLTTGAQVVKVLGIQLDSGSSLSSPPIQSKNLLSFGDSYTEADDSIYKAPSLVFTAGTQDASLSYPYFLGLAFGCNVGNVAFGGQGYESNGSGNVPPFNSSYAYYSSGFSRLLGPSSTFLPAPDYITINGGANAPTTASDVQTLLTSYRAAAPNAVIFQLINWIQSVASTIQAGFTNYVAANPTDTKVFLINLGTDMFSVRTTNENSHPNVIGITQFAVSIAPLIQKALTPTQISPGSSTPFARSA